MIKACLIFILLVLLYGALAVDMESFEQMLKATLQEHTSEIQLKELVQKLDKYQGRANFTREDNVTATMNEYADQVLENIQRVFFENFTPVALPDATLKLKPTGKSYLTKGFLKELNTISRRGDVLVHYEPSAEELYLALPIGFNAVKVRYHHHTKITFISKSGEVKGTIHDVNINVNLSLNLKSFHMALDYYDMAHSGKITIKFIGIKSIDWFLDAMTEVVTVFFRSNIMKELETIIRNALGDLLHSFNDIVNPLLL